MTKPIVVCGVDFSGTSMLAGMLCAAGIDMGDVESAEEVAILDRPVRYRTFEDRQLALELKHLAVGQWKALPDIDIDTINEIYYRFTDYIGWREGLASGKRWGVKCNGLLFLAMHPKFEELPVQWVTTYRPLDDSMDSAFDKLGRRGPVATMIGVEYLAWRALMGTEKAWEFSFEDLSFWPGPTAVRLCRKLEVNPHELADAMADVIDLQHKGVIPCHGSSPPQPLVAHS